MALSRERKIEDHLRGFPANIAEGANHSTDCGSAQTIHCLPSSTVDLFAVLRIAGVSTPMPTTRFLLLRIDRLMNAARQSRRLFEQGLYTAKQFQYSRMVRVFGIHKILENEGGGLYVRTIYATNKS